MGYSINVVNAKTGECILLKHKHGIHGGTYCPSGTNEAGMDITYNYAKWFYRLWPEPKGKEKKDDTTPFGQMFGGNDGGIRSLYGRPMGDIINALSIAVDTLKGEPDEDYWKATEGNARDALFKLKLLCELASYENEHKVLLTLKGD